MTHDKNIDTHKESENTNDIDETDEKFSLADKRITIIGIIIITMIILGIAYVVYLSKSSGTTLIELGRERQNTLAYSGKEYKEIEAKVLMKVNSHDKYKVLLGFYKNQSEDEQESQILVEISQKQYNRLNDGDTTIVYMNILDGDEVEYYGLKE